MLHVKCWFLSSLPLNKRLSLRIYHAHRAFSKLRVYFGVNDHFWAGGCSTRTKFKEVSRNNSRCLRCSCFHFCSSLKTSRFEHSSEHSAIKRRILMRHLAPIKPELQRGVEQVPSFFSVPLSRDTDLKFT